MELMRQLKHPNIVCYLGAELHAAERTISIFQEWVPMSVTSLLVNFGPFKERRVVQVTRQILEGLVYLHAKRVVHRDIKGSNILIDDRGVVKLCDFGASKMLDLNQLGLGDHTRVGSPYFMAPEVLLRQEYGAQVDIWSLAGAMLEMATGNPPWATLNLRTPVALKEWIKR
ncbi:kinase-like domain-containing protein [Tribonema minus]|uniref:Kinase-like domain-containing protein n=1 Tax=Tribonema minus TaxID=303371 RepID=A0A835YZY1_9STRA|nr:kinase-like domain-containing protein [Tribonema minus]